MPDVPVDKRFAVLCEIVRAQHFAWRDAVAEAGAGEPAGAVVMRMWRHTGKGTARAYAARIDRKLPLAPQVAACVAWSSACMGEDARVERGESGDEAFVRHVACPWLAWHERRSLLAEDRAGCDEWFRTTVDELSAILGASLRVETIEALPSGGRSCLRRIWNES